MHSHSGFSLIEVTIAIGVLSFAAVSILGLIPGGLAVSNQSQQTMVAARLAAEVQSEIQQVGLDSIPLETTFFDANGRNLETATSAVYQVYRSIQDCLLPGSSGTALKRVLVQIVKNPAGVILAENPDGSVQVPAVMEERSFRFHVASP